MDTLKTLPAIEQHLAAHGLSLLYIVSRDCGVCHAVEPKLESVLADWPQIAAVRADVAELPALAGRFHALAAPVVILFAQGHEVWRVAEFIYMDELAQNLALWATQYPEAV